MTKAPLKHIDDENSSSSQPTGESDGKFSVNGDNVPIRREDAFENAIHQADEFDFGMDQQSRSQKPPTQTNGINGKRKRKPAIIEDSSSDSDSPLAKKFSTPVKDKSESEPEEIVKKPVSRKKRTKSNTTQESKSDNPPAKKVKKNGVKKANRKTITEQSDDSDTPLSTKIPSRLKVTSKKGESKKTESKKTESKKTESKKTESKKTESKKRESKKTESKKRESKKSESKPQKKSKASQASSVASTSTKVKDEDENGEDEDDGPHKWWEMEQLGDGTKKWATLEHSGVLFAPPYEPLPKHVKMKYDGHEVTLDPDSEEIAGFFAALIETDHARNPVFCQNFFEDFKATLENNPNNPKIEEFERCDFRPIFEYLEQKKAEKRAMSKEEKKALKEAKEKADAKYMFCLLDGRKEKVGNFRVEPPGLFRGRGKHPKTGKVKQRILPEQITINIGKSAKVPEPPLGHQWGKVVHDDTVTWLATWTENVNNNIKYVFLAAGSSLKGQSDMKKFEKARELKNHIDRIRSDYRKELRDKVMSVRQRSTAMYLIDVFALRAGNEKGDDEADTVGCCSLRFEHVTLSPPRTVTFDFLGKDSIRYYNQVEVEDQVFKNLKIFKKEPKTVGDMLFDRLTTTLLNQHLSSYMKGLSAKVFRTYNASITFQEQLKKTPVEGGVVDKILAYNRANREVAILCNHQRSVSKNHETMIGKIEDRILALKYQRWKIRRMILTIAPELAKTRKELSKREKELTDNWIIDYEASLLEKEREKVKKRFEKENEKLQANDEKPLDASVLEERLEEVEELRVTWENERVTGEIQPKRATTVERLDSDIKKVEERIKAMEVQRVDKDENKTTALGTSKLNYIDPRLTAAWCKTHDVPIEKMFSKTLREKFPWALDVDSDWKF